MSASLQRRRNEFENGQKSKLAVESTQPSLSSGFGITGLASTCNMPINSACFSACARRRSWAVLNEPLPERAILE